MSKPTSRSKTNLFLIEMLLSLLFLSLACTVCVQIFAAARTSRQKAGNWNHIQELTISVGELLEGWDQEPETMASLLPQSICEGSRITCTYDSHWNSCSLEEAVYTMEITLSTNTTQKQADLSFLDASKNSLYDLTIRFPLLQPKEVTS